MTAPKNRYQCPHCGRVFGRLKNHLIPVHNYPEPTRAVCPGTQQAPRNPLSDRRRLWKDGGEK